MSILFFLISHPVALYRYLFADSRYRYYLKQLLKYKVRNANSLAFAIIDKKMGIYILIITILFGARKAFTAYYRPNASEPETSGRIELLSDRIQTPKEILHLRQIHRIRCHTDGIQGQRLPVFSARQHRYSGHARITLFHSS